MEKFQNKPWLKIGLLVIAGLILAAGVVLAGYWYGIKSSNLKSQISKLPIPTQNLTPSQAVFLSPTPAANPTANWKTYINNKYAYSIKYPQDENNTGLECSEGRFIFHIKGDSGYEDVNCRLFNDFDRYSVEIIATTDSVVYPQSSEFVTISERSITVDNVLAKELTLTKTSPDAPGPNKSLDIYFTKNGKNYMILFRALNHQRVFDQILSTFKFLE